MSARISTVLRCLAMALDENSGADREVLTGLAVSYGARQIVLPAEIEFFLDKQLSAILWPKGGAQ